MIAGAIAIPVGLVASLKDHDPLWFVLAALLFVGALMAFIGGLIFQKVYKDF